MRLHILGGNELCAAYTSIKHVKAFVFCRRSIQNLMIIVFVARCSFSVHSHPDEFSVCVCFFFNVAQFVFNFVHFHSSVIFAGFVVRYACDVCVFFSGFSCDDFKVRAENKDVS